MGQTLTHGVYLPDEGERNCYNGLASNWSILDGAVGTIAEHTSALSGKAPLVHTHVKSDITDFPAYGNAAGTICEGNDSRLSDARTPVAHTHSKSDVTDLFNSANTWTGDNTFTKFVKNAPTGLDISKNPSSTIDTGFRIVDKDGTIISNLQYTKETSGNSQIVLNLRTKDSNNVLVNRSVCLNTDQYGTWCGFRPNVNNAISLGSSSLKWKTLNGINPGALSLPSGGTTENTDWFNVAGDILPTGGNATSFSRETANYFTPAKDGWLALAVKNCSEISVWCESLKYGISIVVPNASVNRQTVIPVVAGKSYQILITGNSWTSARLIMPQGNV